MADAHLLTSTNHPNRKKLIALFNYFSPKQEINLYLGGEEVTANFAEIMANDNPEEVFDAFVRAREDQANSVINASAAGTSAEELVQTPEQEELSCIESKSSDEGDASAEESQPELQEREKYQTPHKKLQQKGGLSIHKDIPQNQNKYYGFWKTIAQEATKALHKPQAK